MLVVIDTFCSLAFAKCYSSKMPVTACDLLYERVLPFYDALGVPVKTILTDNGREFCGKPGKPSLRAAAGAGGHRAPQHQGQKPAHQWASSSA